MMKNLCCSLRSVFSSSWKQGWKASVQANQVKAEPSLQKIGPVCELADTSQSEALGSLTAPPIIGSPPPPWLVDCYRLRLDDQMDLQSSMTASIWCSSSRFPRRLLPCREEECASWQLEEHHSETKYSGEIPFSLVNGERSLRLALGCPKNTRTICDKYGQMGYP